MIQENIAEVEANIALACEKAGRSRDSVTLIAVSKTKPLSMLVEAYDCGMREFGENKVQEICEKAEALTNPEYHFHMIGHLQTNKVKKAVLYSTCIHSVDSLNLAETINKEAAKLGKIQDILLEVNIAEEESKFGLTEDTSVTLAKTCTELKNIRLRGLMTVAPYTDDMETNRPYFRRLRELKDRINSELGLSMDMLSMGMSGDYPVAISEGATHVRVGTNIFGARNYSI